MNRLLRLLSLCAALSIGPAWAAAPERHEIELRLDPPSGAVTLTDAITAEGRDALVFRLAPWLTLEEVKLDGQAAEARAQAGLWQVALPDRNAHQVTVRLNGTLPPLRQGDPSQRAASGPEGSLLMEHAGWLPLTGADRIAYRLSVETPAPYRAVATGRLAREVTGAATNHAVFVADTPADWPSLFAGPYEVAEKQVGELRLRSYFHPELADQAEAYLAQSARYIARYAARIGAYPYADFHIVSSPLPVGLGFPNIAYIGRMIVPLPFMRGRSLAHEVLHNWWGNGVAVDYPRGNWAEGLTTYLADYALAADEGTAREMRLGWLRDYAALPADRDGPVVDFVGKRHEAAQVVGYGKLAFVFHMLERELGEAVFTEALRGTFPGSSISGFGGPARRA
jgi:aminopeptidase N